MSDGDTTILIIDDEDPMREVVRTVLETAGYSVLDAPSGQEALQLARNRVPDLVLCDIEMPVINGFEVLHMFRKNASTAVVPFIFLTGRSDRKDMRKGMELGADDFLTKPFGSEELLNSVKTRLSRRAQEDIKAEKKLEALRLNISTSVPHELRTPLTGILGFARILKEQASSATPEDLSEIADHIIASGDRLQRTLEKFWLYAEIRFLALDLNAKRALRKEYVPRVDSLTRVITKERAAAFQREDDLDCDAPEQLPLAISNGHLTELLNEVIDNAFKFSKSKTPVKVVCRIHKDTNEGEIEVTDQGRGLDEDHLRAIGGFMQFERSHYEQQGVGMGLAIAKEIAELYDGTFTVRSSVGEGTSVSIRLPLGPGK